MLKWGQLDEIPVPHIAEGLTGRAQIIFGRIVPGGGPGLGVCGPIDGGLNLQVLFGLDLDGGRDQGRRPHPGDIAQKGDAGPRGR